MLGTLGVSSSALGCSSSTECDDANPCTDDLCSAEGDCLHSPNSLACSDGNACTTNDVCNGGTCVGGTPGAGCTSCQGAATLPTEGGTFLGVTTGISSLAGTCGSTGTSPERVYVWTPTASGQATISTCGDDTGYDTVVYVRQGTCAGSQLACNDDTAGCGTGEPNDHHGSSVTVSVTAGTPYYIVVDGYGGAQGQFALTVSPPSVCGNGVREGSEACDGADDGQCTAGCSGSCTCLIPSGGLPDLTPIISDVSIDRNATVSAGDVVEGCAEQTSGIDLLRFSVTSLNNGTADLTLGNPGCPSPCVDHPLEICANPEFTCSPSAGHNHAHYLNYASYELLDGNSQAVVVGHKQGYCLLDSLCDAPKYTCGNQGITAGCADVYGANLGCQYLDITGLPAGNYTLRVRMDPFGRIPELNEGNNVTTVNVVIPSPTAPPPSACDAPTVLPAAGGVFTGTTAGTSTLTGCVAETAGAPERVFQWTPSVSGTAEIKTCGANTSFDTVLYVRQGSCAAGTAAACNDDTAGCGTGDGCGNAGHHGSRVLVPVTAGQPYFIVVDGFSGSCGGASGAFRLTVTPPGVQPPTTTTTVSPTTTSTTLAGGACAAPTVVPAAGGVFNGTTSGASTLSGCAAETSGAPEKVFRWTPTSSGTATFETCGGTTGFDTVVYVKTGTCSAGTIESCNDDTPTCSVTSGCGNGSYHGSRVSLAVTAGQTYYVVVDGYAGSCSGSSGPFTLRITAP
jgi:hypothetical protein